MTSTSATTDSPITLDEGARQQLAAAKRRRKRIDRAIATASFNGWTAAVLAAFSSPLVLFDPLSILAVLILAAVAYCEFRGRAMLSRLDRRGPVLLAANQSVLGVIVIIYAVWQLIVTAGGSDPHLQELAGTGDMGKQIADMERNIALLVYILLIPATILFQGGMAWFYLRTGRAMRAFVSETPAWVIDLLKAAG